MKSTWYLPKCWTFRLGAPLGENAGGKVFDMAETVPVYAKVIDAVSGVDEVLVSLASPSRKFMDLILVPGLEKDVYVGQFNINPWYESGEYTVTRIAIRDRARIPRFYYPTNTCQSR